MQAKNLEELELQAPFIERTLRPLAAGCPVGVPGHVSSSFTERTEKRLALAGNPGDLRVADWLGIKAIGAIVGGILFFFLFASSASSASRSRSARASGWSARCSATRSRSSGWVGASRSARRPSC